MQLKELLAVIENAAPFSLQEDYDNSGIQIGHPEDEINKALICLDVTPEVIREAERESCDVIVTHHPLLFKGIKQLSGRNDVEKIIVEAIKKEVAIVSVHTNLDNVQNGVNQSLANRLGLQKVQVLDPVKGLLKKLVTFCPTDHSEKVRMALFESGAGQIGDYDCCSYNLDGYGTFRAGDEASPFVGNKNALHTEPEVRIETIFPEYIEKRVLTALMGSHPYEEVAYDIYPLDNRFDLVGAGMIGFLPDPLDEKGFLSLIKEVLGVPVLRHSAWQGRSIRKVALCGGSGAFLAGKAAARGADAFVTAEVKYNQFMDHGRQMLLVDAGHYETEQYTKELLAGIIQKKLTNFAVLVSEVNTNPVHYF